MAESLELKSTIFLTSIMKLAVGRAIKGKNQLFCFFQSFFLTNVLTIFSHTCFLAKIPDWICMHILIGVWSCDLQKWLNNWQIIYYDLHVDSHVDIGCVVIFLDFFLRQPAAWNVFKDFQFRSLDFPPFLGRFQQRPLVGCHFSLFLPGFTMRRMRKSHERQRPRWPVCGEKTFIFTFV